MIHKVGPHVIGHSNESVNWALVAPVVKGLDNIQILASAGPQALQIFRHYFEHPDFGDAVGTAAAIVGALGGYRHPNLHVEIWNETHIPTTAQWTAVVQLLHSAGLKVAGPSWGTGDYTQTDWNTFRAAGWCGFDLIAIHCYWAGAGRTPWNAYRYRTFWKVGDPHIVITETGRDIVRDGPNGTYIGEGGWIADKIIVDQFWNEVQDFDKEISADYYIAGATIFTCAPTEKWLKYNSDPLAVFAIPATSSITKEGKSMKDAYPLARWVQTTHEWMGRAGFAIAAIVDHIAQGGEAAVDSTFQNDLTPDPVSAHFEVNIDGSVHQYVGLSDRAWANGVIEAGNTIPAHFKLGNPNNQTVSIEHAGLSGQPIPEAQYQGSLALHIWIIDQIRSTGTDFPIDADHIIGHYRISPQTRPNCPGSAFPFARLLADLTAHYTPMPAPAPLPRYNIGSGFETFLANNQGYGVPRENAWVGIHGDTFCYITATPDHPLGPLLIWRKSINKVDVAFDGK